MGVRRKFEFTAGVRVAAPTPGRTPITGAPPYTGCVWVPPGKTTLPKLRVMPGDVLEVPPGNPTLPQLRCTAWPNTLVTKASERTTASAFMANPLTELYRFGGKPGGQGYFFFGAGVGAAGVGLGATGAAAAGAFAAPGAAVPGLAWS